MTPNQAYNNPDSARKALRNMRRNAKHNAPAKPEIGEGDHVRVRVKPIESRGSYRVTETAWSERVYRVNGVEHTSNGVMFTLQGWQGGPLLARDVRQVEGQRERRFPVQSREMRNARAAADRAFPVGPVANSLLLGHRVLPGLVQRGAGVYPKPQNPEQQNPSPKP